MEAMSEDISEDGFTNSVTCGSDSTGFSSASGWSTGADDDDQVDLFDDEIDPIAFLDGMIGNSSWARGCWL